MQGLSVIMSPVQKTCEESLKMMKTKSVSVGLFATVTATAFVCGISLSSLVPGESYKQNNNSTLMMQSAELQVQRNELSVSLNRFQVCIRVVLHIYGANKQSVFDISKKVCFTHGL